MSSQSDKYNQIFLTNILHNQHEKNEELESKVDVNSLIEAVNRHKFISSVGKSTYSNEELQNAISNAYLENKVYQLKLTKELLSIKEWFKSTPFLVLKGPVLSQFIYNDPAERCSWDLDILIDLKDLDFCTEQLIQKGYDLITPFNTPKQKEAILKNSHQFEFYNADTGILIELHWRLTSTGKKPETIQTLQDKIETVQMSGQEFNTLKFNDQFEYLAIHGGLHLFFRLQWLSDIHALFIEMDSKQIDSLIKHCKENKSLRYVLLALNLIHIQFKTPLDENILSAIHRDSKIKNLTTLSMAEMERTTLDISKSRWKTTILRHQVHYLTEGMTGLRKSLFSRNVRPKNWQFFAFPDSVFFLNHLFSRVIWIVGKMRGKL